MWNDRVRRDSGKTCSRNGKYKQKFLTKFMSQAQIQRHFGASRRVCTDDNKSDLKYRVRMKTAVHLCKVWWIFMTASGLG